MLGLTGLGWMTISLTIGFVVHEIYNAIVIASDYNTAFSYSTIINYCFSISSGAMWIYAIIAIFLGPVWYGSPLLILATFLISGPLLHRLIALICINGEVLAKIYFPILAVLQLASAVLAFVSWF